MNNWNIPDWLENEIKNRDKHCVYCGIKLLEKIPDNGSRKVVATWEHIINDAKIINRNNIARCCFSCNASKGAKKLTEWILSNYCKKKNINEQTVTDVVKRALKASV